MDVPAERLADTTSAAFDIMPPATALPLDPSEAFDLHRAINERRAQVENPELLRHLRSL